MCHEIQLCQAIHSSFINCTARAASIAPCGAPSLAPRLELKIKESHFSNKRTGLLHVIVGIIDCREEDAAELQKGCGCIKIVCVCVCAWVAFGERLEVG
jgi:hypothetical protein